MTEVGHMSRLNMSSIVFKPDPRAEFRVLTESLGCPGQFFFLKKSKRRCFSIKKSQQGATSFLTGSCRVTSGFSFPCFFFNPARFQLRIDPSGRVLKLWCRGSISFKRLMWPTLVIVVVGLILSGYFQHYRWCYHRSFSVFPRFFLFFFSHLSSLLHMSHVTFLNCIIFLDIFYCVILFI
jgi:hypothetical protein